MRRGLIVPTLPVEFVEGSSATLSPSREYWVTAAARLTLAKSARLGDRLKVINSTDAALTIFGGGNPISGVDNTANRYSDQSAIRLPANGDADFVRSRRGWRAKGCDRVVLSFDYNGVPLSLNDKNPLKAGGILAYFGIVQGIAQGTNAWQNPTTGAATVTAAASAVAAGTPQQLSDRVAGGQDVYSPNSAGSWFGWRFPSLVKVTGFIFQTHTYPGNFPRNWQFRVGDTASLINGQNISGLAIVDQKSNQSPVAAVNSYSGLLPINNPAWGNTIIWQSSGVDSSNVNYLAAQEIEFLGEIRLTL